LEKENQIRKKVNSGTGDYTAETRNYSSVAVASFTENEV
jgi:hypothetical protein